MRHPIRSNRALAFPTGVNRLFDDFFRGVERVPFDTSGSSLRPLLDLHEVEGDFVVETELPGVAEADIDVTLDDGVLTIKGEKRSEERGETANARHVERTYGSFSRSVRLPEDVDAEKVEAKLENGVLTVRLPKAPEVETAKTIPVRAS